VTFIEQDIFLQLSEEKSSTLSLLLEGTGLTRSSDTLFFNYYGYAIFQFYVKKAILVYAFFS